MSSLHVNHFIMVFLEMHCKKKKEKKKKEWKRWFSQNGCAAY